MGILTSGLAIVFAAASIGLGLVIGWQLARAQRRAFRHVSATERRMPGTQRDGHGAVLRRMVDQPAKLVFVLQLLFSPLVAVLVLALGAPKLIGLLYVAGILLTGGGLAWQRISSGTYGGRDGGTTPTPEQ